MKSIFNQCNMYIILWCLYNLQGWLYQSSMIVGRLIMLIILLLSIYYFIIANQKYTLPQYLKGLNLFVIVYSLYGVILLLSGNVYHIASLGVTASNYTYLQYFYMSFLPVYAFFVFTKENILTFNVMKIWIIIFVVISTMSFFIMQQTALEAALLKNNDVEEVTNNAGYIFLSIIPGLLLFYKKPFLQYVLLLYCSAFIILAMKRGSIIDGIIIVGLLLVKQRNISKDRIISKKSVFLFSVLFLIVIFYIVKYLMESSIYFMDRIIDTQEGNSSGRDELYSSILSYLLNNPNPIYILFGRGAFGTLEIGDNFAHNDWLELAVCQGLLGITIFINYWINGYRNWKNMKENSLYSLIIGLCLLSPFIQTFFSMMSFTVYSSCILGFSIAHDSTSTDYQYQ